VRRSRGRIGAEKDSPQTSGLREGFNFDPPRRLDFVDRYIAGGIGIGAGKNAVPYQEQTGGIGGDGLRIKKRGSHGIVGGGVQKIVDRGVAERQLGIFAAEGRGFVPFDECFGGLPVGIQGQRDDRDMPIELGGEDDAQGGPRGRGGLADV